MSEPVTKEENRVALLANGSSPRWNLSVNESIDLENEWSAELEGPNIYLVFRVLDLCVFPRLLVFLRNNIDSNRGLNGASRQEGEESLTVGRFGHASVSIIRDDEIPSRCFLVVGPKARSTLRLSVQAEDIIMWIEALEELVEDLPDSVR